MLAVTVLAIIPAALLMPKGDGGASAGVVEEQTLREAVGEAFAHRGFMLLNTGFFVCGFHVAFITVHFPAYVSDLGLGAGTGAIAISLIGLFNIFGSYISGMVGQRWSKKTSLASIYFVRAITITTLMLAPKTEITIYLFAIAMGLLWLSTVPLTTGIVGQIFGVRYMATLFGIVFLSHQLGSFSGVWLGGWLHDKTGSYDPVWWTGVALGLLAALIHIPIDERQLARFVGQHDRDAVADGVSEARFARDQLGFFGVIFKRALGDRTYQDFKEFGIDAHFAVLVFFIRAHEILLVSRPTGSLSQSRCRNWPIPSAPAPPVPRRAFSDQEPQAEPVFPLLHRAKSSTAC
jgi:MFS family permease